MESLYTISKFIYWSISHSAASKDQGGITNRDIMQHQFFKSQLNFVFTFVKITLPWTIKIMIKQLLNEQHLTTAIRIPYT